MTLSDLILNSLDRDYSLDRAAADLGALITEQERLHRVDDPDTPQK